MSHAESDRLVARHTGLVARAAWISGLTLASRLVGYARETLVAGLFGDKSAALDAFVTAWRIPNLFRGLMGEGAIATAMQTELTRSEHERGVASSNARFRGLFLLVGIVYERRHTRRIVDYGGLAKVVPVFATFFMLVTFSSIGLPLLNGFVGEVLCLMGTFVAEHDGPAGYPGVMGPWFAVIAASGLILGAMYLLILLGKIVWSPLKVPGASADPHEHAHGDQGHGHLPRDLNFREIAILVPIALACLGTGLYPRILLDVTEPSVRETLVAYPARVNEHNAARELKNPKLGGKVAAAEVAP